MKYQPLGEYDPNGLLVEFGAVFGRVAVIAAVAAQNSHAQLLNPVGSSSWTQVLEIWVSLATAGDVSICDYDTALATDDGLGIAFNSPVNFNAMAHVRHTTNAGILGTEKFRAAIPANVVTMIPGPRRLQLSIGKGLVVVARTVNVAMNVSFVFYE